MIRTIVVVGCVLVLGAALSGPVAGTFATPDGQAPKRVERVDARPNSTKPPKPPKPLTRDLIGLTALERELGDDAPTGMGVVAGHVEGGGEGYLPNIKTDFFKNVAAVRASGEGKFSSHANATALIIYGQGGLAPGIERVHFFRSADWLSAGCLHVGTDMPPSAKGIRIFNNSWIGGDNAGTAHVLRRADYMADRENVFIIAGVNNNKGSPVPGLMGSAYNAIAVGNYLGQSSGGYTRVDGKGRCKPDIVAPQGQTSFSTPVVTSIVARLIEAADRMGPQGPATKLPVIKAVLLAGAEKPEGWKPEQGKPLDPHFGAGRARVDTSHAILTAGQTAPGPLSSRFGWAYEKLAPQTGHAFEFETPRALGETSIVLSWNRRIDGRVVTHPASGETVWIDRPRLADFDLRLVAIDNAGTRTILAQSASLGDNVEHIYLTSLPRGRYRLEVARADSINELWDYGLAFRIETERAAPQPTAPTAANQ